MIDIEKRRLVMQRSIKLGHCICNPKQACPCEIFKQKDICPCAGERAEYAIEEVALTQLVEKAGCASKINQNDLKKVLAGLPEIIDERVLVGTNTCDDAGVFVLDGNTALVQTVDVFTPGVDDPYTFGQIAAANSLSDVYAMGGKPLTALSIIGFPIETLSHRVMTQMLRGGMDKMAEAEVPIIGGHSINDHDPKFGYAVTGVVNPSKIVTNDGAKVDDILILTKPIGVGFISFANQLGRASTAAIAAASRSMTELNKTAAEVMIEMGVNSATDVTGFGLLGHLSEMAAQSGVTAEVYADQVPFFDEVLDYAAQGMISGGVERNKEYAVRRVSADGISDEMLSVLCDPQTSGGLLMSVPQAKVAPLLSQLRARGVTQACVIGTMIAKTNTDVVVKAQETGCNLSSVIQEAPTMAELPSEACCGGNGHDCCAATPQATLEPASTTTPKPKFGDFMKEVMAPGAIPFRTKELMAIALSLLAKCEPCIKVHIEKAKSVGISEAEIQEAVWMAIAFGGAPTMMFYESVMGKE